MVIWGAANVKFCPADTLSGGSTLGPSGWRNKQGGGWEYYDFSVYHPWTALSFGGEFIELQYAMIADERKLFITGAWFAADYIPCNGGNQGGN
jgi:hypothetical protein